MLDLILLHLMHLKKEFEDEVWEHNSKICMGNFLNHYNDYERLRCPKKRRKR